MEIKETLITPATATTWLEQFNGHNRSVRDSTVHRYARDMKAGRWRLTHQGIAFGPDGQLLDGQHRLFAITEAECAVRMMVARGVSPDVQAVIDDNMPRSVGDGLKLQHETTTSHVEVAIAKWIATANHVTRPTRQEIIGTFLQHQTAITFASSLFSRRLRGVTITPVLTVIARAWYSQDHAMLRRFAEVLITGRLTGDHEDAGRVLRNWLLEGGGPAKKSDGKVVLVGRDQTIYGKTERALAAFLNGQTLGILYVAPTELFPLPDQTPDPKPPSSARARALAESVNGRGRSARR